MPYDAENGGGKTRRGGVAHHAIQNSCHGGALQPARIAASAPQTRIITPPHTSWRLAYNISATINYRARKGSVDALAAVA